MVLSEAATAMTVTMTLAMRRDGGDDDGDDDVDGATATSAAGRFRQHLFLKSCQHEQR